jgi:hypothetical protein
VTTVPADVVGDPDTLVRLYLALPEQQPAPIAELPVGSTPTLVFAAVALTPGRNDFTATIRSAAGESAASAVVTWIFDPDPPTVELLSHTDGQTVNAPAVALVGRTQPRSAVSVRNESTGATVTGSATPDGAFELALPLAEGPNAITISALDPAGNPGQLIVSIVRGTGELTARLSASPARLALSELPRDLQMDVAVNDPDGRPLEGAVVTFTLSVPGVQVVTSEAATGADGRAVFRTSVPQGAAAGQGLATVLVRTEAHGETTDRAVVTLE